MTDTSLEQVCRNLLEQAVRDGLILVNGRVMNTLDPQEFTAGDMCGMANMLSAYLAERDQR